MSTGSLINLIIALFSASRTVFSTQEIQGLDKYLWNELIDESVTENALLRVSLEVQWLTVHLSMQRTQVRYMVQGDAHLP